jgi:hypothetical protein
MAQVTFGKYENYGAKMSILDLFSKRQKRERGEVIDVFQYSVFDPNLKVQIVHILNDAFGEDTYSANAENTFGSIVEVLCREYGVFELVNHSRNFTKREQLISFFLNESNVDKSLDVVELCFRIIDKGIRDDYSYKSSTRRKIEPDDAISELNERFLEKGFGFRYESGIIIKASSEYVHENIIKKTLKLLYGNNYQGPNEEFLKAHEHYRNGKNKECINECLKAFESTMKVICKEMKYKIEENWQAKKLIDVLFEKNYIPSIMQSELGSLRSLLESGVPTLRNRLSGHGQGETIINIDNSTAEYALNLTAANIIFLITQKK